MTPSTYPAYKPSGTSWLGDIPRHWARSSLKYCVQQIVSGGTPDTEQSAYWASDDDESIAWVAIGDMTGSDRVTATERRITRAGRASKDLDVLPAGTLLYSMYASVGKVAVLGVPAAVNQAILGIVPDPSKLTQSYLRYWLTHLQLHVSMFTNNNTQDNLNAGKVRALPVAMPPLTEQSAIVRFLDFETAKIDALVEEQRRLIELLKEKRQAVISHAVTKGLNSDAPMKPSGVEWLGDVPQHWHVIRLKYLITSIEQGWSPQCAGEPADDGEWGVLKVGCVNGNRLNDSEQKELPSEFVPPSELEINEGDILMSRGNTLDLVGMAAIAEKVRPRLLLSDLLYRFRVLPDQACGQFVVHVLRSPAGRFQLERDATGTSASMKKISQRVIAGIAIAIPPLEEQHSIVSAVRLETNALDQLTATAVSAIDLLRERRTALVSAAVTGQIDVRGIAAEEVA